LARPAATDGISENTKIGKKEAMLVTVRATILMAKLRGAYYLFSSNAKLVRDAHLLGYPCR